MRTTRVVSAAGPRKVRHAVKAGEVSVDTMSTVVPGEYNRAVRDNFARLESDALQDRNPA